ncbi:hypothetical protein C8J56DRAFT_896590 [Mycena floridula]|nr:hypothetical protein C8J56DRAFT_896590 [Mycena floridula]
MHFKRGLSTRWATAIIDSHLRCFSELPFNGVDDISAEFIVPTTDAAIAWAFSDHAVDIRRFRAHVNPRWILSRIDKATETVSHPVAPAAIHVSVDPYVGIASLADMSDTDDAPYDSESDSDSDDGMPPLIDLSDSDSGYGSD